MQPIFRSAARPTSAADVIGRIIFCDPKNDLEKMAKIYSAISEAMRTLNSGYTQHFNYAWFSNSKNVERLIEAIPEATPPDIVEKIKEHMATMQRQSEILSENGRSFSSYA